MTNEDDSGTSPSTRSHLKEGGIHHTSFCLITWPDEKAVVHKPAQSTSRMPIAIQKQIRQQRQFDGNFGQYQHLDL